MQQAAKARGSCNLGADVMTSVWTIKNENGEVLSPFTGVSPLEVRRKLVPAHYDAFRLQVLSTRRASPEQPRQDREHEDHDPCDEQ